MTYRRRRKRALSTQAVELTLAVPQVLSHRLNRLALAGSSPSLRDRREFYLMGTEKIEAFYESWNAMVVEMVETNLKFMFAPVLFWWSPWGGATRAFEVFSKRSQRAALAVLGSGLAPFHRRAVANARRLRRVRVT